MPPYAGITPALVSYYFPDKWSLLEAAAKPIIDAYIDKIRSALSGNGIAQDKLRNLAYVLIEFSYDEGYLLDFYVDYSQREEQGKNLDKLEQASKEVGSFMEALARCGILRGTDASFLQSALWSLCKTVDMRSARASFRWRRNSTCCGPELT